jgi:hypothetical protein
MKAYFPVWLDIPLHDYQQAKKLHREAYELDFMKRRGPLLSAFSLFKVFKKLFPQNSRLSI